MKERKFMGYSLVNRMRNGEKSAIIEGLLHRGSIFRMNAIGFSSMIEDADADIVHEIQKLKDDSVMLDGYRVSDFAIAALSLMGVEEYKGDQKQVKDLITSKFDFLRD